MKMNLHTITASIVLYNNNPEELKKAIDCALNTNLIIKLYLIDNSPTDQLNSLFQDQRFEYIFNNANIGFGAAHNIAIKKSIESGAKYHLIMNPDISFEKGVIENIFNYMEFNPDVGLLMPKILSENGEKQYLPKLIPSPLDLLLRKIPMTSILKQKVLNKYELRSLSDIEPSRIAIISGCFAFFRTEILNKVGFFDENYFMYFEDFDISRRAMKYGNNLYYPMVSVIHGYKRGANMNLKLTKIFIQSAITYFNKWGWFIDKERVAINKATLKKIK